MYKIKYEGKEWTIRELADHVGLHYHTLWRRLMELNVPVEEAVKKQIEKSISVSDVEADLRRHRNKKVKHKISRIFKEPIIVGEIPIACLRPAKPTSKRSRQPTIPVICQCGYEENISLNRKKDIDLYKGENYLCPKCLKKSKKEVNQAIINLARNKKALKKSGEQK